MYFLRLHFSFFQVEELQPRYSKLNYVFLAKVSTCYSCLVQCGLMVEPTRTKQCINNLCSIRWQCYKDLGQMEKARKMCEAACSMNAISKEVNYKPLLYISLTGFFPLAFLISLSKMYQESEILIDDQ